jgi:hypothetical protein
MHRDNVAMWPQMQDEVLGVINLHCSPQGGRQWKPRVFVTRYSANKRSRRRQSGRSHVCAKRVVLVTTVDRFCRATAVVGCPYPTRVEGMSCRHSSCTKGIPRHLQRQLGGHRWRTISNANVWCTWCLSCALGRTLGSECRQWKVGRGERDVELHYIGRRKKLRILFGSTVDEI